MSVPPENPNTHAKPAINDPAHLLPAHASDDASASKGGYRKWILLAILLVVIGGIVWSIKANNKKEAEANQKAAAAANRPVPVQYIPVQQKTVPVFLSALGTVTAYNTVTLQARVSGQMLAVNFVEGQNVHKGQLLLQIDPRPYQAALDQAIGTLAKDQANLVNMNAEAQRYSALYQAGVISKESQQLQVSNAGQAEGTIKADQAAIEAARVNLAYTKLYSPIDGVVGLRTVDPGNIVNATATTGLVTITQIHPISVIFTLPEDQLPLVQQALKGGKKLVVEAYDRADSHKIATGSLLTIDNQIDTTTGTAKLKAVFDNADNGLFANQFVNVRLILRERQNATVIPTAAIESGTQGDYVFVVNNGPTPDNKKQNQPNAGGKGAGKKSGSTDGAKDGAKSDDAANANKPKFHVDAVTVHVDFVIGTSSIISDGQLKPGQQVVVDGQEKLVDGANVQPQASKNANPQPTQGGVGAGAMQTSTPGTNGVTQGSSNATPGDGQHSHNGAGPGSTVGSGNSSSNGNGGGD